MLRGLPLWASAALFAAAFALVSVYRWVHCPAAIRHIPAVPAWKTVLFTLRGGNNDERLEMLRPYTERYPLMRVFAGKWRVFVNRPHLAKTVFLEHKKVGKNKVSDFAPHSLRVKTEAGIVASNTRDGSWQRHRQVSNPAFRRGWDLTVFGDCTREVLDAVRSFRAAHGSAAVVPMNDLLQRLTLDVLGKALFGYNFRAVVDPDNAIVKEYNAVMDSMFNGTYDMFPILDRLGTRRAMFGRFDALNDYLMDIVANKRNELLRLQKEGTLDAAVANGELDLLQTMIYINEKGDGDGNTVLSDAEMRATGFTYLVAGHDTTSHALAAIMWLLAAHPRVQDTLRAEVLAVMGSADPADIVPTHAELKQMPYLDAVIKEALRLYGPVRDLPNRVLAEDVVLDGTVLPKGTLMGVSIRAIQRLPDVWDDADAFKPERHLSGAAEKVTSSWIPFGGGVRMCIGQSMTLHEQQVVVAMLVRRFKWRLPPGVTKPLTNNQTLMAITNASFVFEENV
ncbi:cytochrome P450 [Ramicandelaber brevisporus]|nr:cytochrome P450 [Ramicandelaber brevisporus]